MLPPTYKKLPNRIKKLLLKCLNLKLLPVFIIIVSWYFIRRKLRLIKSKIKQRQAIQYRTKSVNRHRIVFGGCANMYIYQAGVMKAILKHFGTEKFKTCDFEGISGGAATAGYSCMVTNGCNDMDWMFKIGPEIMNKYLSSHPFGMVFGTSPSLYDASVDWLKAIKTWKENNSSTENAQLPLSVWVTSADALCNVQCPITFNKPEISATRMVGSCFIPLLFAPKIYYNAYIDDGETLIKCMDGGIGQFLGDKTIFSTKNVDNESCKVLYINCDLNKKRKYNSKQLDNGNVVYFLDICKWDEFSWKHFYLWADNNWAKMLFDKGHDLAIQNMHEIETILKEFFEQQEEDISDLFRF